MACIRNLEGFEHVRFVILYGSQDTGNTTETSDIDICVFYDGEGEKAERFRFRVLSSLMDDDVDIHIFQHLPAYIRIQIFKGEVLFNDDPQFLYDTAYREIKEFEDFRHRYYDYIGMGEIS